MGKGWLPSEQEKETNNNQNPKLINNNSKPLNPPVPSSVLHSQDKAPAAELFPHLKSSSGLAWHFVLSSDSFITGRNMTVVLAALRVPLVGQGKA